MYLDGAEVAAGTTGGSLENWTTGFPLAVGNEISGDRPWLGSVHLVAMYDRALAPADVMQNFAAGPNPTSEPTAAVVPSRLRLAANRPNPFNPSTEIRFELPSRAEVTLEVLDLRGRRIATLVAEPRAVGRHTVTWDGRDDRGATVASGTYLTRLRIRDADGQVHVRSRSLTLLK
jgi:hypothetical protein